MTESVTLTPTRFAEGIWEGVLAGGGTALPEIKAFHLDRELEGLTLTPVPRKPGQQLLQLPIPLSVLSEGVQTVLVQAGDTVLARITIVAGVPLEDDLRAEIGLLRAELELLKRAFRRHCAETSDRDQNLKEGF